MRVRVNSLSRNFSCPNVRVSLIINNMKHIKHFENYSDFENVKNSLARPNVSFIEEKEGGSKSVMYLSEVKVPKLISFTIQVAQDIYTYQAEEGMNWYTWCLSSYNLNDWWCDDENSEFITGFERDWGFGGEYWIIIDENIGRVHGNDIIKPNYSYNSYVDGWGLGDGGLGGV